MMGVEFELFEGFEGPLTNFRVGEARGLFQWQGDIFQRGERIEDGVALEEKTAAAAEIGAGGSIEVFAIEADEAGIRRDDAREAFQQHGFARAAAAQHGDEAAAWHIERGSCEHDVVLEALVERFDAQQRLGDVGHR